MHRALQELENICSHPMEGSSSAAPPSPQPAGFIHGEHLPPPPDVPPPDNLQDELIRLKVEEVSGDGNVQTQGGVGGALQGRKKGASMTPDKLHNKKDQQKNPANALPRKRPRTLPIVRSPGVNHFLSQGSPRIVGVKRSASTPSQLSEISRLVRSFNHNWDACAVSVDGDVLLLVSRGGWMFYVDIDGQLVENFHRDGQIIVASGLRLKQTLVQHTFFTTLEGYAVNALPFV